VSDDDRGERAARDAEEAAGRATAARDEAADLRADAARDEAGAAGHRADAARREDRTAEAGDETAALREEAAGERKRAEVARVDTERAGATVEQLSGGGLSDLHPSDPVINSTVRDREAGVDADNPLGVPGPAGNRRSPFRIGFFGATGVGTAWLLYQAIVASQGVLVLVIVSAFLAIGLNPMVTRLESTGMKRGAAVGIVFLGLMAFFVAFGLAVLPPVITQVANFVEALPGYIRDLQANSRVRDWDSRFGIVQRLNDYVTGNLGTQIAGNVVDVTQRLAGIVFKGLTILILTLYFLSSFNSIKHTAYRLVPRSRRARFSLIGDEILSRVGGYVAGAVVVALIAGVSTLVWTSSLGIPYPLALALIVAITDVIPLIGATLGAVIVTAVAFFVSLPVGIATGIFFIVYQQLENYFVYPRVMSRSVDVNPAAAIVGALIGGTLLGFVGALLAVPATAAIQLILREVLVPRQDAR